MRTKLIAKILAALLVVGLAGSARADFVSGTATLPSTKRDIAPLPPGADPTRYLAAADYNALMNALLSVRAALIGAISFGFTPQASAPTPPLGGSLYQLWTRLSDGHLIFTLFGTDIDLVAGSGAVSLPNGQIGYGTGSGVTSDPSLTFDPSTGLALSGGLNAIVSGDSSFGLRLYDTAANHSSLILRDGGNVTELNGAGVTHLYGAPLDANAVFFNDGRVQLASRASPTAVGEIGWNGTNFVGSTTGSTWDVTLSGGSTGNYTFSGNTMDLSASGVMTIGSTNTTATELGANAGAATLEFLLDATFGSPYYDLQLTTPSAVLNVFNQSRDGVSLAAGQLFDYIAGVALTSLTSTRFQPTSAGGLSLGTDSVPWANITGYAYSTKLGAQITAAASITPTTGLQHWTGATTVTTIVATNFSGNWVFKAVCDVTTCSYGTGGNIAVSGTFLQGKTEVFQYDATATTWYPQ